MEERHPEDCSTCRWKFGSAIFTLARLPWVVKHRVEGDTCLKLINDYVDYVAFDISRIVNDKKKKYLKENGVGKIIFRRYWKDIKN